MRGHLCKENFPAEQRVSAPTQSSLLSEEQPFRVKLCVLNNLDIFAVFSRCLILGNTFLKKTKSLYRFRTRKMFNVVVTFSNKEECVFSNSLVHDMYESVCMYKNLIDSS